MNKEEKQRRKQMLADCKEQKQKTNLESSQIELYPQIENILADTSLKYYFRPLLTNTQVIDGKEYKFHLLGTDGLFCEKKFKNSEGYFFGFDYNNGKYKFLGKLECFEEYEKIPALYDFLQQDFRNKKDEYLNSKLKFNDYFKQIEKELKKNTNFNNFYYVECYADAFYSYEFTKYHYEQTGIHKHISVLTENYGENEDDFLFSRDNAMNVLEEFFINLEYNLENDYGINKEMFCCATDEFRFMSICGGGMVFVLFDKNNDKIYLLRYHS
jgi:hypothetical protein